MADARPEWKRALEAHMADDFAHPQMIRTFTVGELDPWKLKDDQWKSDAGARLTTLEKAMWTMAGAFGVVGLMAGGGILGFLLGKITIHS